MRAACLRAFLGPLNGTSRKPPPPRATSQAKAIPEPRVDAIQDEATRLKPVLDWAVPERRWLSHWNPALQPIKHVPGLFERLPPGQTELSMTTSAPVADMVSRIKLDAAPPLIVAPSALPAKLPEPRPVTTLSLPSSTTECAQWDALCPAPPLPVQCCCTALHCTALVACPTSSAISIISVHTVVFVSMLTCAHRCRFPCLLRPSYSNAMYPAEPTSRIGIGVLVAAGYPLDQWLVCLQCRKPFLPSLCSRILMGCFATTPPSKSGRSNPSVTSRGGSLLLRSLSIPPFSPFSCSRFSRADVRSADDVIACSKA